MPTPPEAKPLFSLAPTVVRGRNGPVARVWQPLERAVSEAVTQGIRVKVRSEYRAERSNPARKQFFFAYTVRIYNEGQATVQLISRHWIITDAHGHVEEVRGPGVVGEQPVLRPGTSFEYTSGCPLSTEFGTMHGTYQMRESEGAEFDAVIAPFRLAFPHAVN